MQAPASAQSTKSFIKVQSNFNSIQPYSQLVSFQPNTRIDEIKINFMEKHSSIQGDPKWNSFVAVWQNFVLNNNFSGSQLKVCISKLNPQKNQQQTLTIYEIKNLPAEVYNKVLVLWTDSNFQENFKTYKFIVQKTETEDRIQLVQLQSNQKLIQYLEKNKFRIDILYQLRKVFFVSNMNRKPHYKNQGIETLKIARENRPYQLVVFYIGDKKKASEVLEKSVSKEQLHNVVVLNAPKELASAFVLNFLNPILVNQSAIWMQGLSLEEQEEEYKEIVAKFK